MSLPPELNSTLIASYIQSRQLVVTTSFASLSFLIYDHLLTLPDEFTHFWPSTLSYAKPLFFLTRYLVFVDVGLMIVLLRIKPEDGETCRLWFGLLSWFFLVGVCSAEAVLALRTFALWGCRVFIRRLLGILCMGVLGAEIYHVKGFVDSLEFAPLELGKGCIIISTKRDSMVMGFALVMMYDTVILVLTIIRAFTTLRRNRSALVITLYRDGVVFYFALFIVTIANVLIAQLCSLPSSIALIMLQRISHATLTSRIMLNLASVPRQATSSYFSSQHPEKSYHQLSSIRDGIEVTVTFFGKEPQFDTLTGELVPLPTLSFEEEVRSVEMKEEEDGVETGRWGLRKNGASSSSRECSSRDEEPIDV